MKRMSGLVLAAAWGLTFAAMFSFDPLDPPSHAGAPLNNPPANWCGSWGAGVAYEVFLVLGPGAWVILMGLGAGGCFFFQGRLTQPVLRLIGLILAGLSVSGVAGLLMPQAGPLPEGSGGLIAITGLEALTGRFGGLGTFIVLGMILGVGSILAADELVMFLPNILWGWMRRAGKILARMAGSMGRVLWALRPRPGYAPAMGSDAQADSPDAIPLRRGGRAALANARQEESVKVQEEAQANQEEPGQEAAQAATSQEEEASTETEEEASSPQAPPALSEDQRKALRDRIAQLPIHAGGPVKRSAVSPAGGASPKQDLTGYQFPPSDLLSPPQHNFTQETAGLVRQQAETLEKALNTYGIEGQVVGIDAGPSITLYEVQLAPGTKVSRVSVVASDVARELKAHNIRIVPNTAGKSTVGIEVPNLKKEMVRLKELLTLAGPDVFQKMHLPMFLGKDASGNGLIADLAAMPHMLIAGTTGSGKSVCLNAIIMSFLLGRRPDELKLILVDPKMVELSQFHDVPHLLCPVVTEMNKALAILEWAVTKMDERYELLSEASVRDIEGYNNLSWKELAERFDPKTEAEEARIPRKLPRLVFIIDELADLIITHKEVEGFIVRIAQKARAVGIHLILATQRPQANVVTGLIKSNMPCRISFKVNSGMDSRIVLDSKGAELLLGAGDMLYISPRSSKLTRAQGCLVDDQEVRNVVGFLRKVAQPSYEPELVAMRGPVEEMDGEESQERDPLFEQAVQIVLETGRGSVSLLQRRLAVGYSRASRLIEEIASAGIIGDYKGSQARQVNMTIQEWETLQAQSAAQTHVEADTRSSPGPVAESTAEEVPEDLQDLPQEPSAKASKRRQDQEQEYEYVEEP